MDSANSGTSDEEFDSHYSFFSNTNHQPLPVSNPFNPLSTYIQLHNNSLHLNPNISCSNPNPSLLPTQTPIELARNPKKRARASRRAPTTVLTTDPTNFRAMVQQFTGIPAQPFSTTRLGIMPPITNLFTLQNPLILHSTHKFQISLNDHVNASLPNLISQDHIHNTKHNNAQSWWRINDGGYETQMKPGYVFEKVPEKIVTARGEGMVESWVNSSSD